MKLNLGLFYHILEELVSINWIKHLGSKIGGFRITENQEEGCNLILKIFCYQLRGLVPRVFQMQITFYLAS